VHISKEGKQRLRNGNFKALQAPSKPLLEVNIFFACTSKRNEAQIRHFGSSTAYKLASAVFKIISEPWYFSGQGRCKTSGYASRKYLCGVSLSIISSLRGLPKDQNCASDITGSAV